MRSRSSSKHRYGSLEVERSKTREEPQLSGAYIRSLVKQLSSSRTKEPMNPRSPNTVLGDELSQDPTKLTESPGEPQLPQPSVPPQPKKQVRRRLHTSRPYQERLLNMAEARREIVTALKFHRASMKQQAVEQQQQQHTTPPLPPPPPPPPPPSQPSLPLLEETTPRVCHTNSMLPNYFHNPPLQPYTYPSPYSWPYPPITPLLISDNLNLPLPNQPLGLNLSFQGFSDIESPFYRNKPSIYSPSSPSSSSSYCSPSPSPSPMTTLSGLQLPTDLNGPPPSSDIAFNPPSSVLHPVMDDDEIAEIQSLGQQHDMEWNDTVNLMTSAWWCKFLNNMEMDSHEGLGGGDGFQVFEEIMDIPAWLSDGSGGNTSESSFLPQHFDDYYLDNYLQDTSLSWLDIGEIEGLDGDWLS